jgi:hypothetical protein
VEVRRATVYSEEPGVDKEEGKRNCIFSQTWLTMFRVFQIYFPHLSLTSTGQATPVKWSGRSRKEDSYI